jgi:hypothetical protein
MGGGVDSFEGSIDVPTRGVVNSDVSMGRWIRFLNSGRVGHMFVG